MIKDNTFSYLKANTVLFAQKMCEALSDMCGAQFIPLKESIREGAYSSQFDTMLFIGFTGAIQGYYLLSFDNSVALKLIGAYEEDMPIDKIRDLREDFGGLLKESLNLAVGQSIEELEKSFSDLTFAPSTIVYGEIEFPNIMCGSITMEGREGQMLCGFSLNLANLKIGERLEETLKELEQQSTQTKESRRNIESILQLLPTGLLAINSSGEILPGYSTSTPTIIGHQPDTEVVGQYLPEFIGAPAALHESWKNWLSLAYQKFGDLPFTDIKDLCPLGELTNTFKHILKINWYPITGEDGTNLDKMLVVIEDVSRQRELETKMEEMNFRHQENLELISQVINLQPDEITDFIYDSSELLSNATKIVTHSNIDREFINELFRTFHTLKGSSGQYQFKSLQELAHKVEDHLKVFRDTSSPLSENTIDEIKHSIDDAKGYIERIQDMRTKLGGKTETIKHKAFRDPQTVMASLNEINAVASHLGSIIDTCNSERMYLDISAKIGKARKMVLSLRTISLSFFESSFNSLIENTCRKTNKQATMTVSKDVRIDVAAMRKLHQCLIHLINNAIDHGIEIPEERLRQGKIETGMIILSGHTTENEIIISFEDDGKGIDLNGIRKRLHSHYNYSETDTDKMSDNELFTFLLIPGFSTKEVATEISGRGVGMDFVNHTIKEMGGTISLKSARGKGTTVTLTIPK